MGVSVIVDFIRGLALAIGCRFVYVLFNSIHNSNPRGGSVLKQRSDLNFNTVTIFMMTNVNVQDWANFRILTNPPSCSRSPLGPSVSSVDEILSSFDSFHTSVRA